VYEVYEILSTICQIGLNNKWNISVSKREKRDRIYVIQSMTYVHRIRSKDYIMLINLLVYNTKVPIYRV